MECRWDHVLRRNASAILCKGRQCVGLSSACNVECASGCPQGRERQININKLGRLSRDWVAGIILSICFSGVIPYGGGNTYRSIQIDYRQRLFLGQINSNYRYRIELPEELMAITETDLWEFQQKISHYRYRFSLEFQLISITDTDFGLKTN